MIFPSINRVHIDWHLLSARGCRNELGNVLIPKSSQLQNKNPEKSFIFFQILPCSHRVARPGEWWGVLHAAPGAGGRGRHTSEIGGLEAERWWWGACPKEEGNWETKLWACEGKEDTFRREVLGPGHRPASMEVGLPRSRDIPLWSRSFHGLYCTLAQEFVYNFIVDIRHILETSFLEGLFLTPYNGSYCCSAALSQTSVAQTVVSAGLQYSSWSQEQKLTMQQTACWSRCPVWARPGLELQFTSSWH